MHFINTTNYFFKEYNKFHTAVIDYVLLNSIEL